MSNFDFTLENRLIIYKLIRAIGLLLSLFFYLFLEKKYNEVNFLNSFRTYILFSFIAVLGAKFSSVLEFLFLNNFSFDGFDFSRGFRISGIAFFVIIAISLIEEFNLKSKIHLLICSVLGLFVIGKWSCFILGDTCYGFPTNSVIGFVFMGLEPSGVFVHPVTIYDSLFYSIYLLILCSFLYKFYYSIKLLYTFTLVALIYSFSMEFLRVNPKVIIMFSMNNVFYGISIIYITVLLLQKRKIKRNKNLLQN